MATNKRAQVLAAVQEALRDRPQPSLPILEELEPPMHDPTLALDRFTSQVRALGGEAAVVADAEACALALQSFLAQAGAATLAFQSAPLAAAIAARLPLSAEPAAHCSAQKLARVDCGLLAARCFIADSGAAVCVTRNAGERMLPYLPRVCAVVGYASDLQATLGRAVLAAVEEPARVARGGEALILCGPSRTADIEKILVLGAHGPKQLGVFVISARGAGAA